MFTLFDTSKQSIIEKFFSQFSITSLGLTHSGNCKNCSHHLVIVAALSPYTPPPCITITESFPIPIKSSIVA